VLSEAPTGNFERGFSEDFDMSYGHQYVLTNAHLQAAAQAQAQQHAVAQQQQQQQAVAADPMAQAAQLELAGQNPNAMAIRRPFDPTAHDLDSNFRLTRFADLKG